MKTILISVVCFLLGGLAGGLIVNAAKNSAAAEEALRETAEAALPKEKDLPPMISAVETLAAAREETEAKKEIEKEKPITVAGTCYLLEQYGYKLKKQYEAFGVMCYSYRKAVDNIKLIVDIIPSKNNPKYPLSISFALDGPKDIKKVPDKSIDTAMGYIVQPIKKLSGEFKDTLGRALKNKAKDEGPGLARETGFATSKNGWQITWTIYMESNKTRDTTLYQLIDLVKI